MFLSLGVMEKLSRHGAVCNATRRDASIYRLLTQKGKYLIYRSHDEIITLALQDQYRRDSIQVTEYTMGHCSVTWDYIG